MEYREIINNMKAEKKEIEKLVKGKGSDALPEIARVYGIKPRKAKKYLQKAGIEGVKHKPNSELEKMAQEGLPQAEIGARLGMTRQAISQYLIRRDLIDDYRKERKEVRKQQQDEKSTRTQYITQLHDLMIQRALSLARQESWAAEQAFLHCLVPKLELRKLKRFDIIKKLFANYESAATKGEIISYVELAEMSGLKYASDTRNLLIRRIGKESLKSSRGRAIHPQELKRAIEKAHPLNMHHGDIAYLVGLEYSTEVPVWVVGNVFSKIGKKENKHHHVATFEYGNYKRTYLNYRDASQIYEAADLKFRRSEITALLGLEKELVDYALEFRDCIEKIILQTLDTINPNKKHTRSY